MVREKQERTIIFNKWILYSKSSHKNPPANNGIYNTGGKILHKEKQSMKVSLSYEANITTPPKLDRNTGKGY